MGSSKGPWGWTGLLTLVVGAVLLALFRVVYPETPLEDTPLTLIILLALIGASLAVALWRRRQGRRN
jgi:RsiW-degrading membrane proteinase PrsW (M82 family)